MCVCVPPMDSPHKGLVARVSMFYFDPQQMVEQTVELLVVALMLIVMLL